MLNKDEILYELAQYDSWNEELLGEEFLYVVEHVLTKSERIVLEMKVEGYDTEEICKLLKIQPQSFYNYIQTIKSKLTNDMTVKEYELEWWMRQKDWEVRQKKGL